MPTFLFGLPLHPLVVHAVVVLVPVAALGALAVALWPAARRRWGWAVVVVVALAAVSVPLATSTGEGLEHNLPRTAAIATHAELGDQLLVVVAPLLLVVVALVLVERSRRTEGPGSAPAVRGTVRRVAIIGLAVATVLLAGAAAVQVVRIGDSGARAAWGDVQYTPQPRSR
ncbi:DUF2231 domain-containing protein [Pseudonocardia oroxyli]|uniref:DUF2231 domain-containing protein n=1 Tax=Pseudonocardia oroxyli TaxID=366584 RepID=A0A1G7E5L7_PSEOR|nr:DUF2231 domain-containing protein [Pseudonocardia oroxyli]SDE58675.1 hypothetical protein SAMN05216377_101253 [Pseudonocardia oroxyli]